MTPARLPSLLTANPVACDWAFSQAAELAAAADRPAELDPGRRGGLDQTLALHDSRPVVEAFTPSAATEAALASVRPPRG